MSIGVLLVDDAPEIRRLVRTALRFRGGFEVLGEAGTGTDAVALAERLEPDVIVLDLGLPDLAGKEVLSRVRAAAPTSRVVIFSGAEDEDREWYEGRAAGYVLKDAELDYLVDLLESVGALPQEQGVLDLPVELAAVHDARQSVRAMLVEWGLEPLADDASLVVTELAANAVEHAATASRLRVTRTRNGVRLEVHDSGDGTPEPQPPSETAEGGRGLLIVGALSAAWGIEHSVQGKTVWAELTLP